MKLTRAVAIGSAALLPLLSGCDLPSTTSSAGPDIVIAADLELSGAAATLGTAYERALRLKVEQINADGVLDGRKIRLDVKDNRSDKTLSVTNISEFANDPSVDALITGASAEAIPSVAKTLEEKQLPTVSLSPADEVTTPVASRRYVFKVAPNPGDNASAIATELARSNIAKVGLLTTDDTYGEDGYRAMKNELDGNSGTTVKAEAKFKPTDTDVSQPVRQVVEEKPGALVVFAFADQAERVASSARAAGFNGPIYFDAAAAGDLFLVGSSATATENTTMIFTETLAIDDVVATTPAKAARKQWFRDYTARYGSYYGPASFAADAVQVLLAAIEKAGGTTDPSKVRSILESVQLDGLSGPIRITPANHSGLMPQALVALVASAGRWRLKI